jgi:glycosyltransferase involved in cell wall biosynthesis
METLLYSVVLPVYNQADQIGKIVGDFSRALDATGRSYELIMVVNGSRDDSWERAKREAEACRTLRVFCLEKGGWGKAVKFGLAQAQGEFLCYLNSARTNVADMVRILGYAEINKDVVIKATRIVREKAIRKMGSILYNLEARLVLRLPVWDINGTPKVIPRSIYRTLTLESEDDLIDAEIMAKVINNHVPIMEIPVVSTQRISGKSTTKFRSAFRMYTGLLKLAKKI